MFQRQILVFDFETSGLDETIHSPLSLGCYLMDKNLKMTDQKYYLIKPREPFHYTQEALNINGFKNSKFSAHVDGNKVVQHFHCNYGQKQDLPLLAGWNVHFDIKFLKGMYERANLAWPFGYRALDVQSIACWLNGGEQTSLHKELKRYNKHITHNALQDAEDTAFLLREYSKVLKIDNLFAMVYGGN